MQRRLRERLAAGKSMSGVIVFTGPPVVVKLAAAGRLAFDDPILGKALGIPEPKDSAGETLWYAISPAHRDATSNALTGASDRINSDTLAGHLELIRK